MCSSVYLHGSGCLDADQPVLCDCGCQRWRWSLAREGSGALGWGPRFGGRGKSLRQAGRLRIAGGGDGWVAGAGDGPDNAQAAAMPVSAGARPLRSLAASLPGRSRPASTPAGCAPRRWTRSRWSRPGPVLQVRERLSLVAVRNRAAYRRRNAANLFGAGPSGPIRRATPAARRPFRCLHAPGGLQIAGVRQHGVDDRRSRRCRRRWGAGLLARWSGSAWTRSSSSSPSLWWSGGCAARGKTARRARCA